MASKSLPKPDLEFCLERLEIPLRKHIRESTHILDATLIWPRTGIAKRTSSCETRLERGVCDKACAPWHERILFQESCEGRFALNIDLTVSVTRTQLRKWRRTIAGYVVKSAGELADDFGGFAGEVAEAPLKVLSKELQTAKDPELYATGAIDLNASEYTELPEGGALVEIPLISALDITKVTRRLKPLPVVGKAFVRINVIG
ncbi:MAG: hypothetical protein MJ106_00045 [Lentisphaeria bacterium]|nr:hypothetical protein [Lentisphaeria bacterium]